jgi:CheY-like chemotaxis protein
MNEQKTRAQTIVVVEDDPDTLALFRKLCELEGFRVVEARDGLEAVAAVRREAPSLVMMDLSMPHMDGIDAAREMRRDDRLKGIPILFVTAHGDMGMDLYARSTELEGGAVEYLPKPVDNYQLMDLVRSLTGRAGGP